VLTLSTVRLPKRRSIPEDSQLQTRQTRCCENMKSRLDMIMLIEVYFRFYSRDVLSSLEDGSKLRISCAD
jgi:hypothetical protein